MTNMDKKPTLSPGMDPFSEIDEFTGIVFFTETYGSYDVNTQKVAKAHFDTAEYFCIHHHSMC